MLPILNSNLAKNNGSRFRTEITYESKKLLTFISNFIITYESN